ncbi:MAG: Tautomerase enzyme [Solirubrobacteraceae bacterium]|jgi:phenylpyruvate tautomerase PptA (4-oxalocrotonate tautomerase family)
MPMIDITMSEGALDVEARKALAERVSSDLIELEGAVDNPYARSITWCFIDERREIYVAGIPAEKPVYRVVLTVPEGVPGLYGPLTVENRRTLVRRVTAAVLDAERTEFSIPEAARVWVQIRQIDDGHWGGFGELVTIADIAAYGLGIGPENSVGQRIRESMTPILDAGVPA